MKRNNLNQNQVKYKIGWDEKEKIFRLSITGKIDEKTTIEILKESGKLMEQYGKENSWLINLSKISKLTRPAFSAHLRKEMIKLLISNAKMAVVGASTTMRVIINFLQSVTGKSNFRFFKTEKEALKWLKEEKA